VSRAVYKERSHERTDGMIVTRLDTAQVAKLVRKVLKRTYPAIKFSVRTSRYSGGSAVDVSYTDGPTREEVDGVLEVFGGATFDGMIDLKGYKGPIEVEGDLAADVVELLGREPEGLVSMGADWVTARRELSDEAIAKMATELEEFIGAPVDPSDYGATIEGYSVYRPDGSLVLDETATECPARMLREMAWKRSF
jgi:hypothetical protein